MTAAAFLAQIWRSMADAIDPAGSAPVLAVKAYVKGYCAAVAADERRKQEAIDTLYAPIAAALERPSAAVVQLPRRR